MEIVKPTIIALVFLSYGFNISVSEITPSTASTPTTTTKPTTPSTTTTQKLTIAAATIAAKPPAVGTCNSYDLLSYGLKPAAGQREGMYKVNDDLLVMCEYENDAYITDKPEFKFAKGSMVKVTCTQYKGGPKFNVMEFWPNGRACGCHTDALANYGLKPADQQRIGTYRPGEAILVKCADDKAKYVNDDWGRVYATGTKITLHCKVYSFGSEFEMMSIWHMGTACYTPYNKEELVSGITPG